MGCAAGAGVFLDEHNQLHDPLVDGRLQEDRDVPAGFDLRGAQRFRHGNARGHLRHQAFCQDLCSGQITRLAGGAQTQADQLGQNGHRSSQDGHREHDLQQRETSAAQAHHDGFNFPELATMGLAIRQMLTR
jgi:hypothetical protein